MDDASWAALTLSLTVLGGIWTWFSFRRRGFPSGLRAFSLTLLPLAAYLTKTLQMFTNIVSDVGHWATNLVFNPFVWSGVALAGVSVVLFVVSGMLRTRQLDRAAGPGQPGQVASTKSTKQVSAKGRPAIGGSGDDDMDEIEALLRKRGIS